jgi:hypothetical protein
MIIFGELLDSQASDLVRPSPSPSLMEPPNFNERKNEPEQPKRVAFQLLALQISQEFNIDRAIGGLSGGFAKFHQKKKNWVRA